MMEEGIFLQPVYRFSATISSDRTSPGRVVGLCINSSHSWSPTVTTTSMVVMTMKTRMTTMTTTTTTTTMPTTITTTTMMMKNSSTTSITRATSATSSTSVILLRLAYMLNAKALI